MCLPDQHWQPAYCVTLEKFHLIRVMLRVQINRKIYIHIKVHGNLEPRGKTRG